MGVGQIEELSRILSSIPKAGPADLAEWELSLTCDHVVLKTQHRDNGLWTTRVVGCPTCGVRRGVVHSQRLETGELTAQSSQTVRLNEQLQAAESKLQKQLESVKKARLRIRDLTRQLEELSNRPV
jgi:hypothetical protein